MTASALAAAAATEPLARTSEGSKSGPIGLAIILLLCVACYFLFKSMSGHLRRVREGFPKNAPNTPSGGARAVTVRRAGDGSAGAGPAAVESPPTEHPAGDAHDDPPPSEAQEPDAAPISPDEPRPPA